MIFLSSNRARARLVHVCDRERVSRGAEQLQSEQCSLEAAVTSLSCRAIAHIPKAGAVVSRRIKCSLKEKQQMSDSHGVGEGCWTGSLAE